ERGRRGLRPGGSGAQGERGERAEQDRSESEAARAGPFTHFGDLLRGTRKWPDEDALHPATNSRRADQPAEPLRAGGRIVVVAAANLGGGADAQDDRDERDQRNDPAAAKLLALDGLGGRRDFLRRSGR